jgi:hypothetical protein
MCSEKVVFFLNGNLDRDRLLNVFLRTIFYSDIAKAERYFLIHDTALSICPSVHDIELCNHADCSDTLWVYLTSHLQTLLYALILGG